MTLSESDVELLKELVESGGWEVLQQLIQEKVATIYRQVRSVCDLRTLGRLQGEIYGLESVQSVVHNHVKSFRPKRELVLEEKE